MRIYLDNCCLQRPLDNQSQPRIRVETEAVLVILAAVQSKEVCLLGSEALDFEVERIPDLTRRTEIQAVLALASEYLQISETTEALALTFEEQGIRSMDAIHLALASVAKADFFCTSDDKFFRKAQAMSGLGCKVSTLLGLIPEVLR
jgi:predicted nucleic acid-binding protein